MSRLLDSKGFAWEAEARGRLITEDMWLARLDKWDAAGLHSSEEAASSEHRKGAQDWSLEGELDGARAAELAATSDGVVEHLRGVSERSRAGH